MVRNRTGERNSDPRLLIGYTWRVIIHEFLPPAAADEKEAPEFSANGDPVPGDRLHPASLSGYDWPVFTVMTENVGKL